MKPESIQLPPNSGCRYSIRKLAVIFNTFSQDFARIQTIRDEEAFKESMGLNYLDTNVLKYAAKCQREEDGCKVVRLLFPSTKQAA